MTTSDDTNVTGTTTTGSDTNVTGDTGSTSTSTSSGTSGDASSDSSTSTSSDTPSGNSSDTRTGTTSSSGTSGTSSGGTSSSSSTSTTTSSTGITTSLTEFTDASTAREESTPWSIIDTEIQRIESEIISAISNNEFSVIITDTVMTSTTSNTSLPYFRVHHGLDIGLTTTYDQMNIHNQIVAVKDNFTKLGYVFQILDNPNYQNVLMWLIMW